MCGLVIVHVLNLCVLTYTVRHLKLCVYIILLLVIYKMRQRNERCSALCYYYIIFFEVTSKIYIIVTHRTALFVPFKLLLLSIP